MKVFLLSQQTEAEMFSERKSPFTLDLFFKEVQDQEAFFFLKKKGNEFFSLYFIFTNKKKDFLCPSLARRPVSV